MKAFRVSRACFDVLVFCLTATLAAACSFDASRLRASTSLSSGGAVDPMAAGDAAEPGGGGYPLVDTTAASGGAGADFALGGSTGLGGVGGSSGPATTEPNTTDASLGTGGASATDSAPGSGGKLLDTSWNTGGLGAGGATGGKGDVTANGGATRTGGATSTGGLTGTGGAGTGGSATGGATSTGGMTGTGGAGTGGSATGGATKSVVISVDFVGGVPGSDRTIKAMAASESAGVKPATYWNSAPGSAGALSSLVSAAGTLSAASITWNSPFRSGTDSGTYSLYFADAPGDVRMMNGYLDPSSASVSPAIIDVTGLAAPMSSGYDVYVYCYGQIATPVTRTSRYAIGSTTHTVTQKGPSAAAFAGYTLAPEQGDGNYVVFRNVTGTGFTLTAQPGADSMLRAPVNGIQIVYPSGS